MVQSRKHLLLLCEKEELFLLLFFSLYFLIPFLMELGIKRQRVSFPALPQRLLQDTLCNIWGKGKVLHIDFRGIPCKTISDDFLCFQDSNKSIRIKTGNQILDGVVIGTGEANFQNVGIRL